MPRAHHAMPPAALLGLAKADMVNGACQRRYQLRRGIGVSEEAFQDEPPNSSSLTSYDREHMVVYLRLLDADADCADWREVVSVLFGIDPETDPGRARHIHDTHLARARWMTEHGYRHLLRGQQH